MILSWVHKLICICLIFRTYNTAFRQTDRNDGRLHTRQNSNKSANKYDEIELHGNYKLIDDDKNRYEELPEGEYDKIFKPRPHVNKGDLQESIYSKGAIVLTMFRRSSFSNKNTNENPPVVTFSTFKVSDHS